MSKRHERTTSQENVLKNPSTMSAKEIDQHTPYDFLLEHLEKHKADPKPNYALHWLHWFRQDPRAENNLSLDVASKKARQGFSYSLPESQGQSVAWRAPLHG